MALVKIYAKQTYNLYGDGDMGVGGFRLTSLGGCCVAEFNPISYEDALDMVVTAIWKSSSFNMNVGYFNTKFVFGVTTKDSPRTLIKTINTAGVTLNQEFTITGIPNIARENGIVFWDSNNVGIIDFNGPSTTYLSKEFADATISNLAINNIDVDVNTIVSWDSTNQSVYELQALQGGVVVYSTNSTTEKNKTIPYNTLQPLPTTFRVRTGNGITGYIIWSDWIEYTATLTKKEPSISILDPNNIQVNRANAITASFAFLNVTSWVYECIQGGVAKFTTNGTIGTAATIPSNVLSNGEAKNKLTATYIPVWATSPADYRVVVKETTFTVYGSPANPTLIVDSSYSTPYPLFKWSNATEQISYRLKIKDGTVGVLDSLEVYGSTIREYLFNTPLENHKTYTAELQIKNQYNLWSDAVTVTFLVEFAELAQPTFNIYADAGNACIVVNVESVANANFHYHEIYRREVSGQWIKIAQDLALIDEYKDFACASNVGYEYKVRAVDGNTAYTDSLVKPCKVVFNKTILSIPFTETAYQVRYNIKKSRDNVEDKTFIVYSGLSQPKMIRGTAKYQTLSISATFISKAAYDEFRAICDNRVLLLRDGKGLKIYGNAHGLKDDFEYVIYSNVSFSFTEVYYKEGDYIESEQRPLSFADSEW